MIKINDIVRFKNKTIARSRSFMLRVGTKAEKRKYKKMFPPMTQRIMRVIDLNEGVWDWKTRKFNKHALVDNGNGNHWYNVNDLSLISRKGVVSCQKKKRKS